MYVHQELSVVAWFTGFITTEGTSMTSVISGSAFLNAFELVVGDKATGKAEQI
jgi:hypothetical protein